MQFFEEIARTTVMNISTRISLTEKGTLSQKWKQKHKIYVVILILEIRSLTKNAETYRNLEVFEFSSK